MLAGSLYAFYMAYLDEDLDELLSSNEKASLEAAYFKFGASQLAYGIAFLPGSTLLFGRLLFRLKNFRQKSRIEIMIRQNFQLSTHWLYELILWIKTCQNLEKFSYQHEKYNESRALKTFDFTATDSFISWINIVSIT